MMLSVLNEIQFEIATDLRFIVEESVLSGGVGLKLHDGGCFFCCYGLQVRAGGVRLWCSHD